jgi:hypothetical protein
MVPMYLLMSAFHSTPWLKLISRRRSTGESQRAGAIWRLTCGKADCWHPALTAP